MYSIKDAQIDLEDQIFQALDTHDAEKLYNIAQRMADSDPEEASRLVSIIRQWDQDDWSYDNSIGN